VNLGVTLRVAVRALLRNKTRSSLTALGIVIGVAAVIAMVAIGSGARAQVEASFSQMGSNLLVVTNGSSSSGGFRGGYGSQPTLTWDDVDAIREQVPGLVGATPQLRGAASVQSDEQNWTTSIQGTNEDYFPLRAWPAVAGRVFEQSDVDGAAKVVVLGRTVAEKLFGNRDPVGEVVRIKNVPFEVIGLLDSKGQSPWGQDNDDVALVPYTTFLAKVQGSGRYLSGSILVGTSTLQGTAKAERLITGLLRDRHRLGPDAEADFSLRNLAEMASAQQQGTNTLTMLLAAIAAVSLLVGGIGIMNIMLVSVTERTREIGLRMAIGARPNDILAQFLVEALALSAIGGLLGVALGVGIAQKLATSFGWPLLVDPLVVVGVVGFSAFVGVLFGLFPAYKASRLDPIEALRFE
jgi:putative ABC transport system permease protein